MTADQFIQLASYIIPAIAAISVAWINRRARTESSDDDAKSDE